MAGENPYLKSKAPPPATQSYKITFTDFGTFDVDPQKIPHEIGLPGNILDIALANGIDIDHACGGVCACSTCHIHVVKGGEFCAPAEDSELDMLELAPDLKPSSRLSCQTVPNGKGDLVVTIPKWNRNLVREGEK